MAIIFKEWQIKKLIFDDLPRPRPQLVEFLNIFVLEG